MKMAMCSAVHPEEEQTSVLGRVREGATEVTLDRVVPLGCSEAIM